MTERGTFVINGAERVIVSQLHRSPGVFFGQSMHTNGTKLYSARIIPFKGSWIEFATDINNVMYAYIDRKKKLPVTTLLRAIGYEADQQILEIFDLADEVKVNKANLKKAVGRKLAARVLSTWVEDFVDEDTGEVVSIERNNVIVDRETVPRGGACRPNPRKRRQDDPAAQGEPLGHRLLDHLQYPAEGPVQLREGGRGLHLQAAARFGAAR